MKKIVTMFLALALFAFSTPPALANVETGTCPAGEWPCSTNALNEASNAPTRLGQPAPHVVLTSANIGSVTLTFKNPSVVTACFERRIDGQLAYNSDPPTTHYYPPLATAGEKVYPYFCMTAGAADKVETYTANSTVEIRHAFGPENDWFFDWTRFDVLPNPDLDDDGVLNDKDMCPNTETDEGVWLESLGTNRWQYMNGDDGWGWYQNMPNKKGRGTTATYVYDIDHTYGCSGKQILDLLTAELGKNAMNGHYKFGLSSSVLEYFHKDMSDGELDGMYLVETITVPANLTTETLSTSSLTNGVTYMLKAKGTWTNSLNVADAEYASVDGWFTQMDGYNVSPWSLGVNEFDLMVDGAFIDWGSYSPSHEYSHTYLGTGSPVKFLIFDGDSTVPTPVINPGWYGDNSGSLTVDIYAQL